MIHPVDVIIYDRLKALTPEERLQVFKWALENAIDGTMFYSSKLLDQCIKVASPDGWKELAPSWEKGWREEKEKMLNGAYKK